jgi:peroxiredoxin
MELSNRNHDFQTQLKQLNFKTYRHNQVETFDYDSLFANRRVVVFSITRMFVAESFYQLNDFNSAYKEILNNKIDNVYAINSDEGMFAPWMDKHSDKILGLVDADKLFATELAKLYYPDYDVFKLARNWQYILILNNGIPEKIWSNPYRPDLSLRILRNPGYQYRKIKPNVLLDYLKNSVDSGN